MNREVRHVIIALLLLILTSWSPLAKPVENELFSQEGLEKRVEIINIDPNQLHNLEVIEYHDVEIKKRPSEAWTRIGLFNSEEFIQTIEIPDILSQILPPLSLKYKTKQYKETEEKQNNAILQIENGKYIRANCK